MSCRGDTVTVAGVACPARQPAVGDYVAALRLPFISASVIPYCAGVALAWPLWRPLSCILGLTAAVCVHSAANLLNDYADSVSGADWQDLRSYALFGGSKCIQRGIFTEQQILTLARLFFFLAALCVVGLSVLTGSLLPMIAAISIAALAASYSVSPGRLVYRGLGELVIFLLFGPALVMGGYYTQTGIFPASVAAACSLPFGCITLAVLVANEVPDYTTDRAVGKYTWVCLVGPRQAYLLYMALIVAALTGVVMLVRTGVLAPVSLWTLGALIPAGIAAQSMRRQYSDKAACLQVSRLTIGIAMIVGMLLVLGAAL